MSILTGNEIKKRLGVDIHIDDFLEENVNPNSYNLTLHGEIAVYDELVLDPKKENLMVKFEIPEEGYILKPGTLYLARVKEYTKTYNLVPIILGRSSIGRVGLMVHQVTGFGDNGFEGYFTLQLTVTHPLRIYPGMKICQIIYHTIEGEGTLYNGRYQNSTDIDACKLYKDY